MEEFATWLLRQQREIRSITVLTGAGISAESGLPTFRGQDGLWKGRDPMEFFTLDALAGRPAEVWELLDGLRARTVEAEPNAGHRALAALAQTHHVALATQNIDGLHQRAGSTGVLEMHGTLWRVRCDPCGLSETNDAVPLPAIPPRCPHCGGVLRPDIVFFSEPLPEDALLGAWQAAESCDLMMVVGTSGVIYPAAALPGLARARGALVVEVNPEPTPLTEVAHFSVRGTAAGALPAVVRVLHGG